MFLKPKLGRRRENSDERHTPAHTRARGSARCRPADAVGRLLEVMMDPVSRSLANAPVDDEPISEEEAAALDKAHASIERGEGIPHEEMLSEFGLAPKP